MHPRSGAYIKRTRPMFPHAKKALWRRTNPGEWLAITFQAFPKLSAKCDQKTVSECVDVGGLRSDVELKTLGNPKTFILKY
jgi:hypothetical protein